MIGPFLIILSMIVGLGGLCLGIYANDVNRFRDRAPMSLFLFIIAALLIIVVCPILMVEGISDLHP